MSDSVQPHRWQPTRLCCPWDSPGKNTGVGCHFLLQCMKGKCESEVIQLCLTLCDPMDCSQPGSSVHGIFQARVLEWGAIAFSKGTPINLQVRSTNCAKLWSGRRGGEDKTSRPNPSPGDVSPGAESHILGNDLGQHRAQGTRLVVATAFLSPRETSPDPRIKAQCTHVKFPH